MDAGRSTATSRPGTALPFFAVSLRRLVFWLAMLLLLVPASTFQLMPRMPHMATVPTTGSAMLAVPTHNITSLEQVPVGAPADSVATFFVDEESMPVLEGSAEHLMEEFEQCIFEASSDDDFTACVQQVHLSSLDELSSVIVKESCDILSSKDDGTIVSLVAHVLHTARSEGIDALEIVSLRRLALRACVSASLHKATVCVFPAVSACMIHVAPDLVHTFNALVS